MTHTSMLQRLQTVDSETDASRARLEELHALLGENREVRDAMSRLESEEGEMQAAQAQTSQLELEIASLDNKAKATSDRLYSGAVANPKELQDMEQELASLSRRREGLEDHLLEAMVALDEAQGRVETARADLKSVEDEWAADQGDLVEEKRALEARLAELESEREGALGEVDAESLAAYEKLRTQRGGLAVALIKDGVCTACGVAPTSSILQKARHGELDARCPTCGRILFAK